MKTINLIGSTGSIGIQTLDVMRAHPETFRLQSMSFGSNMTEALKQAEEFKPAVICTATRELADRLKMQLSYPATVVYGFDGLIYAAAETDGEMLVNAVMGRVGLEPTLKAIEAGKDIAIANKETLVTAGHLVTEAAERRGVKLIPVDSEHSAIYQCLHGNWEKEVETLILTASGGSFRDLSRAELANVTLKDALNHPNWNMGAKITVDSASMMNKGLEVIEAKWLFNMPYDQIDVILHKESIVHSMVEYIDGSVLAHMGTPDMRVPIQYALSEPSRLDLQDSKRLKLWEIGQLHFQKMDFERFRLLQLAYDAGRLGGTAPTVMNAANEVAVARFLDGEISFLQIEEFIERALHNHTPLQAPDLATIVSVDKDTRSSVLTYSK
ncbi:1-deoxy-D-xylulose-5-phosphate reductoisomerase [Salisediminibacterium halotolerans]|uniref:1-deoxy-D-xylulose 5-phosphate reductoisomerase n=1 Tax=Salisediminibacterium halotolerans TaxID=517425 RepID=A0A1H9Q7K6_9BACI|nr:1-deoxy-D-xylulose-5-phosphate reductoisomerase [Salisediminibacterium haloalkalitolerans]SER56546.1 1-deoxy-D-xylulose-5-phosphate reductoisomerase [Salisediminibacterium haloalkalitolerans]